MTMAAETMTVNKTGASSTKSVKSSGNGNKGNKAVLKGLGNKPESYIPRRKWTWESMKFTTENYYTTRSAVNKANGNPATAYYNKSGDYVVVDDITGDLVQLSEYGNIGWIPDSTIVNPYIP